MTGYKLFRLRKDGTLGSLFINRKAVHPLNEWLQAESHPTKGYKYRPYWHVMQKPEAPHLTMRGRVWAEVEVDGTQEMERPESQGGKWWLADKIKVIKVINNEKNFNS